MSSSSLPLCRRQLPFTIGSCSALRSVSPPLLVIGLATGGNPLRASRCRLALAGWLQPAAPAGWHQPTVPAGGHPLQGAWPQPTAPYRYLGNGRMPLQGAWPWPAISAYKQHECGRPSPAGSAYFCCQSLQQVRRIVLHDSISSHIV
ncbi:hypothetical protein B296_00058360 [Ensete ventricosum]|uniref:Uncharacterized protein n=1 Tax=Ensete ventricosum TaxID=4639 RepID=A0A426WWG9_ENSVE|nr:hypothetical protein B296_00058360 [Ensete ventricosum]